MKSFSTNLLKASIFLLILFSIPAANPIAPHWALIDSGVPARVGFRAVYDIGRNSIILFGGSDTTGNMPHDTREWNAFGWQQVDTSGPAGRAGFGMCYDPALNMVVLFGGWNFDNGYLNDTWIWDGSNWVDLNIAGPPARSDFAMTYNQNTQSIILFGGADDQTLYGDTWEWNGNGWSLVDSTGPAPRIFSAMVNIPDYQGCLLFGGQAGYSGQVFDDCWLRLGSAWVELVGDNPSPRVGQMMAYDPNWGGEGSVIMYGGQDALYPGEYYDDTWVYDSYGWSLTDAGEPAARSMGEMVYDDSLGKVILINGEGSSRNYFEMWEYPSYDSRCLYAIGDVNGSGTWTGQDVTYSVRFFKGGSPPPISCECPVGSGHSWYLSGDVNGSCSFTGQDVTRMVLHFKSGVAPISCPNCPPGR